MLPVAAALAACGRATSRAAGRRLGARGDWLVARRREIPIPSRLVRGEGPFDVWTLARDARRLALYACGRGRPGGLAGRRGTLIGSRTSPRATRDENNDRGSTWSAHSQPCVESRQDLWDGLQGRDGLTRARWGAEYYFCEAGSQLPLRVLGRDKIVAAGDDSTPLRSEIKL